MRLHHETQVFSTLLKHFPSYGEYLIATSHEINFITGSGELLSWKNIKFLKLSACGSFFEGSYTLQQDSYDDWVLINQQPCLLTSFITNKHVNVISQELFEKSLQRFTWDIFTSFTRPGFSVDFSQAIIRKDSYCSLGPSQCGSILYLERTDQGWQQKSSYGLYNQ